MRTTRSTSSRPFDLNGRSIMVTGGTGSFGRLFVRTVAETFKPERLIIFSRDELKQYEMQLELPQHSEASIRYFIGDVRDVDRLEMAMKDVDIVIHAAALKQVPAAEYNPFECIRTNVFGAENVVRAAIRCGVKKVIALSTDKAANPVNLYGASKLSSDKIFIAGNSLVGKGPTRFSVVRYGNVMNSRGSVVPLFRRLIAQGSQSLPITDERMTRFWITLPQAVEFVMSCLDMMKGGETFVPKLPSMRVTDLAAAMAPKLAIRNVGIRPGEKLHEAMITSDDARDTVDLGNCYAIEPAFALWSRQSFLADGATRVAEDFAYTSDKNTWWLTQAELAELVQLHA